MKKLILITLFSVIVLSVVGMVGCGSAGNQTSGLGKSTSMSNGVVNVDGAYVNDGYTEEGKKQVVVFLTITAGEANLEISSKTFTLKINDVNEYSASVDFASPNLTEYYYSDIIEDVFVGEDIKVALTYSVPSGDLAGGKSIILDDWDNIAEGISFSTDDLKVLANLEEISQDIDSSYYALRKTEEDNKMAVLDENAAQNIRNMMNGYYWEFDTYVGTQYVKYEVEFFAPNQFEVRTSLGLTNVGTYEVRNNYIIMSYPEGNSIKSEWSVESDGLHLSNPFYSNGADTIF